MSETPPPSRRTCGTWHWLSHPRLLRGAGEILHSSYIFLSPHFNPSSWVRRNYMCTWCDCTELSPLKHHRWDEDAQLFSELSHFGQKMRATGIWWAAVSWTCFRNDPFHPQSYLWICQVVWGSGNSPVNIAKQQSELSSMDPPVLISSPLVPSQAERDPRCCHRCLPLAARCHLLGIFPNAVECVLVAS